MVKIEEKQRPVSLSLGVKIALSGVALAFLTLVYYDVVVFTQQVYYREARERIVEKQNERLMNGASTLEEKLLGMTDSNKNRVIEPFELRAVLDALGYRQTIRPRDDIKVYSPGILMENMHSETYEKYYKRGDIYKEGDTIYIPVKDAKRFLKK